jgi:hypothetical protein
MALLAKETGTQSTYKWVGMGVCLGVFAAVALSAAPQGTAAYAVPATRVATAVPAVNVVNRLSVPAGAQQNIAVPLQATNEEYVLEGAPVCAASPGLCLILFQFFHRHAMLLAWQHSLPFHWQQLLDICLAGRTRSNRLP